MSVPLFICNYPPLLCPLRVQIWLKLSAMGWNQVEFLNDADSVTTLCYHFRDKTWLIQTTCDQERGRTRGHTKTPLFLTGHCFSLAESIGFEPMQDCYTLTDQQYTISRRGILNVCYKCTVFTFTPTPIHERRLPI